MYTPGALLKVENVAMKVVLLSVLPRAASVESDSHRGLLEQLQTESAAGNLWQPRAACSCRPRSAGTHNDRCDEWSVAARSEPAKGDRAHRRTLQRRPARAN